MECVVFNWDRGIPFNWKHCTIAPVECALAVVDNAPLTQFVKVLLVIPVYEIISSSILMYPGLIEEIGRLLILLHPSIVYASNDAPVTSKI